mgnify:CR=1 FL=1
MALLIAVCTVCVAFFASRVGAGVGRDLRGKVYKNVMSFSNAELDKFSTASLITRTTNDVQQIQLVCVLILRMVLYAPIIGIGGVIKVMSTGAGMEWVIALAAQSHVKVSFDVPEYTAEADAIGTLRMLEAVRILGLEKKTRIYQASTSELFGKVQEVPQKETTPFYPRSPYGVAKQYGFWITKNYRESYGMFAVNGILFNHESERRGETFVTRKISLAAARIAQGEQDKLYLGNLDARRDWGYAKDYIECMWLILQHDVPEDFVIATGEMHTVREFATLAFKEAGIELRWEGEGVNEKGIDVATGKSLVEVDPKYFRPSEVEQLLGDPTKAKTLLGWDPRKTSFEELVSIMVRHDMEKVKRMIATKH